MSAYRIGDMVYFWTGRGSHGYATIYKLADNRVFLRPEPDAQKGSDFRILASGRDYWLPRDRGVPLEQIDTQPSFWFKNF